MDINQTSKIEDIKQALYGAWEISEDNGWKCVELGHLKLYKKKCEAGSNVLPQKFLNERTEVYPVIEFRKNSISGQVLSLTQNAISVTESCICVIILF